jgi:hypothetical protein
MDDTFVVLCRYFSAEPDGAGNVWITCPECGRAGRKCSFHPERGLHCFRCNAIIPLAQLAERLLGQPFVAPVPFPVKPPKIRAWQKQASMLADSFTQTPGNVEAWRAYKPLPAPLILMHHLGSGIFPQLYFSEGTVGQYGPPSFSIDGENWWQCTHKRLIIPLYCEGEVVGFRCRSTTCDCPRWLSPGGSKLVLYNGACLLPKDQRTGLRHHLLGDSHHAYAAGQKLLVVENPIDGIWAGHNWNVLYVATLGVSIWKPGWTKIMAALTPGATVLVAYDHDLAGNGGGSQKGALAAAWTRKTGHPAPEPAGIRRVRDFQKAHIKSRLHDWGDSPIGMDMGDYLRGGGLAPSFTPQALPGIETPAKNQTATLVKWFIETYLGRPMTSHDYRSSHSAHAAQLLKVYSLHDIQGCLLAARKGYLDWDLDITYLTLVTKGEPPLMARWEAYRDTPPALWKTHECREWEALTGNVLPTDTAEQTDRVPMWPPGMRPENAGVGCL